MPKKPYAPPCVIRHESETEYPEWTRSIVRTLRQELEAAQFEVEPQYVTVVDSDRKYVEVSDSFCQLVGYQREELLGRRYDELTAPNTNDIPPTVSNHGSRYCRDLLWLDRFRSDAAACIQHIELMR
jgi:PAS domain-containing protein